MTKGLVTPVRFDAEGRRVKVCSRCGVVKPLDAFHSLKRSSDGKRAYCAACGCADTRAWVKVNPERSRMANKQWAKDNPTARMNIVRKSRKKRPHVYKAIKARYCAAHPDMVAAWASAWSRANRPSRNARDAARRAQKLHATPAWANQFFIGEAYELARLRTKVTGIEWQVDHVVPLVSPIVCGLHVEHNLRVITAYENRSKKNYWWPDMPEPAQGLKPAPVR